MADVIRRLADIASTSGWWAWRFGAPLATVTRALQKEWKIKLLTC